MLLALLALGVVATALLLLSVGPVLGRRYSSATRPKRRTRRRELDLGDPGRERRAEQRARELLRSCVNAEEWAMYRELGFIRVAGRLDAAQSTEDPTLSPTEDPTPSPDDAPASLAGQEWSLGRGRDRGREPAPMRLRGPGEEPAYAYLIYPHKPIVAYVPRERRLLSEYCVEFPDLAGVISESRLPASDDVLAKWMAVTGDERRLLRNANMHLPGRQIDPARVRRDLLRLSDWDRRRHERARSRHRAP